VSKKHGQRHKRKKRPAPVACPRCHSPADDSPGALLRALAEVLNSCEAAGIRVRLAHGFAETSRGYVLPMSPWTVVLPPSPPDGPAGAADAAWD